MGSEKEYCDLYDENSNPLGKVHCRGDELAPGEFVKVIGVWTFNSKNQIMLTKRHPEKKTYPNLWENTGGYVMAGETSRAAAIRELREETGIVAEEDEIHYIASVKIPPFLDDDYFIRRDITKSDIVLQEGETVDVKWVTYEELLDMENAGELAPFIMEYLTPIQTQFKAALRSGSEIKKRQCGV